MKNLKETTVGEMVRENIKSAHVFKKFNIDFCCGGGITIEKACARNNVDVKELEQALLDLSSTGRQYDYKSWNLSFLISHIVQIHHKYVVENLPVLESYSEKVAQVHGLNYPEVIPIYKEILFIKSELLSHLEKEEKALFPLISRLLIAKNNNDYEAQINISSAISQMFNEHEEAGSSLKRISELTNNYTPPPGACNTFKALYHLLEEFENDLHLHIHLENNILFPKALELSESMQE